MRAQEKKIRGFSLLELLVVVVIVGLMTTLGWSPFQTWRSDRLVRTGATKASSLIQDIFSQVQRGHYSFVQFTVSEGEGADSEKIFISTNGLKTEKFTELVRYKYKGGLKTEFHKFETRCSENFDAGGEDIEWDDKGLDSEKLTVSYIEIDENLSIGIPGKTSITGEVCFSTDGSYYSAGGAFLKGSGEDAQAIEEFYICKAKSGVSRCQIAENGLPDQDHFFAISWSRFGSITLKKWFDGKWIAQ